MPCQTRLAPYHLCQNGPFVSLPLPLLTAVLGVGKIGSTFAFQLARNGHHDVTVVARAGSIRLQQLQRDNGVP